MPSATKDKLILAATLAGLALFQEINIFPAEQASAITKTVPQFAQYEGVEKKQAFFDWLKPIVKNENALIQNQRMRLLLLQADSNPSSSELEWLAKLQQRYQYTPAGETTTQQIITKLLKRVNTVPVELALTQAAIESAWGTSRFAQQANNLFGQWCYEPGCGLVPLRREPGKTHEVKRFASVNESVRAYLLNLNAHSAYQSLRNKRAALVRVDQPVTAAALASTLNFYSQRGNAYVQDLLRFLSKNKSLM